MITKEVARFLYKINKVFINKELSDKLDRGRELDYELYDALRQWDRTFKKNSDPFISVRKESYDFEYFSLPMTRALLDENVIFFHKYNKHLYIEQYIQNYYIEEAIDKVKGKRIFN